MVANCQRSQMQLNGIFSILQEEIIHVLLTALQKEMHYFFKARHHAGNADQIEF